MVEGNSTPKTLSNTKLKELWEKLVEVRISTNWPFFKRYLLMLLSDSWEEEIKAFQAAAQLEFEKRRDAGQE